ncbi:MAG: 4-alpha-glucanotransferase [Gemmatimonadetes bacterium]|jgi:4-alpha-glucanotransferase|nr:4-alpha-glucanotransferase [Gemmatimonadota bacterium]
MTAVDETELVTERPLLRRLADRMGIQPSYLDQTGEKLRMTSDATREALLSAMGFRVHTEEETAEELRTLRRAKRREWLEPVRVVRQRSRSLSRVRVRVPATRASAVGWTLTLRTEEGMEQQWTGTVDGGPSRRATLTLPVVPPLGYHELHVEFSTGARRRRAIQRLIVVPSQATAPEARLRGRRGFGITANLYSVRSARNWGAGDLGDLGVLAQWVAHEGGTFVGVNPLHVLRNAGYDVSPYSPISRLFRNVIYLRADDVPEMAHLPELRAHIESGDFQAELRELREAATVDYERVMALRTPVLEALHGAFVSHEVARGTRRARAYAAYLEREDPQLTGYATFMAIAEQEGPDARQWPAELRDARSPSVAAFRDANRDRVDYHRWIQFELDRQLGDAAIEAAREGLTLGLYQDLAVGSAPSGSDVWANPELFVQGATVGAPPDMYSDEGQNWGLPAINPHVLRASGYEYWTRLLRASFRHAGALRIDHALGLFRMFWVPLGESARAGAYVTSFSEELFGILALESVRHGALVVGEDLGTVPPEVPKVLARWGVLGSKVAVFERDFHSGRFASASAYPRLSLATVNTHDLPPLAGWMNARDIELRGELGDLADPAQRRTMHEGRMSDRGALVQSLVDARLLGDDAHHRLTPQQLVAAIHAFIRRTPAALVGLSLDDLAFESEPVNIPGVWQDRYASWSRRMRMTLEELVASEHTVAALGHEHPVEPAGRGDA